MAQTAVLDAPVRGVAGQRRMPFSINDIVSRTLEDAAELPFGVFVAKGTADHQCKVPVAATDITGVASQGVALLDETKMTGGYAQKEGVPVLTVGQVYVLAAAGAYTLGQAVNVRYAGTGQKGSITQAAVVSETAISAYAEVAETITLSTAGVVAVKVRRI